MAISPQEALQLNRYELQQCSQLEAKIDNRIIRAGVTTDKQRVIYRFSINETSAAIREELRQRFSAVGWDVEVSSACIILRPKDEGDSTELSPS